MASQHSGQAERSSGLTLDGGRCRQVQKQSQVRVAAVDQVAESPSRGPMTIPRPATRLRVRVWLWSWTKGDHTLTKSRHDACPWDLCPERDDQTHLALIQLRNSKMTPVVGPSDSGRTLLNPLPQPPSLGLAVRSASNPNPASHSFRGVSDHPNRTSARVS